MTRYYFDLQDDTGFSTDDEGIEFTTLQQVQEEAARSLADMARDDMIAFDGRTPHELAIEVRDADGPVLALRFSLKIDKRRGH